MRVEQLTPSYFGKLEGTISLKQTYRFRHSTKKMNIHSNVLRVTAHIHKRICAD